MFPNFFACLFTFLFIILLSIPLLYWLRYVLKNLNDIPLPNILAHLSMIGILFYGLWIALQMLIRGCREGFPTPPPCDLVVRIYDRIQNTNKLSDPNDDTWSFQMIVEGHKAINKGWSAVVNGKTISSTYGMPARVSNLREFSSITFIIKDEGNPECFRSMTVEPPSTFKPTPPHKGSGTTFCKGLENCLTANGFSIGQLPNHHILAYYSNSYDQRSQKKIFYQYYSKNRWQDVSPEEKTYCDNIEAYTMKFATIADSIRVAYYPSDKTQKKTLTLVTLPIQNGRIVCQGKIIRDIKDSDPMLKTHGITD